MQNGLAFLILFSFILLRQGLNPLDFKTKSWGEKCEKVRKSVKKCEEVPICPLVVALRFFSDNTFSQLLSRAARISENYFSNYVLFDYARCHCGAMFVFLKLYGVYPLQGELRCRPNSLKRPGEKLYTIPPRRGICMVGPLVAPYRAILRYYRCDNPYRVIVFQGG